MAFDSSIGDGHDSAEIEELTNPWAELGTSIGPNIGSELEESEIVHHHLDIQSSENVVGTEGNVWGDLVVVVSSKGEPDNKEVEEELETDLDNGDDDHDNENINSPQDKDKDKDEDDDDEDDDFGSFNEEIIQHERKTPFFIKPVEEIVLEIFPSNSNVVDKELPMINKIETISLLPNSSRKIHTLITSRKKQFEPKEIHTDSKKNSLELKKKTYLNYRHMNLWNYSFIHEKMDEIVNQWQIEEQGGIAVNLNSNNFSTNTDQAKNQENQVNNSMRPIHRRQGSLKDEFWKKHSSITLFNWSTKVTPLGEKIVTSSRTPTPTPTSTPIPTPTPTPNPLTEATVSSSPSVTPAPIPSTTTNQENLLLFASKISLNFVEERKLKEQEKLLNMKKKEELRLKNLQKLEKEKKLKKQQLLLRNQELENERKSYQEKQKN